MKLVPVLKGSRPAIAVLQVAMLCGLADPAAAFTPPAYSANGCYGFGAEPYFADVVASTPGNELVVMNVDETIKADTDMDGLSEVLAEVVVKVVDRAGTVLWTSSTLAIKSSDAANVLFDQYILNALASDTFAATLFVGGLPCYGSAFAVDASGQQYLAVIAGFMTQSGNDIATGVDESKLNVWILDRDTGAVVYTHTIRPRADKYLMAISLTGVGPVDGDADDELVVSWAIPTDVGKYTILTETYNILTGAMEDRFQAFMRNTRTVE